jgi:hypothetical protein
MCALNTGLELDGRVVTASGTLTATALISVMPIVIFQTE